MFSDYSVVLIFITVATGMGLLALFASWILRPSFPTPDKLIAYECGERPVGMAWIQYNARFYLFALIFVVFDVEVLFLIPWALNFRQLGWTGFAEMLLFVGILMTGLAYAWKKQVLKWY